MTTPRFQDLFRKVLNRTATKAEKEELHRQWAATEASGFYNLLPYNDWEEATDETPLSQPMLQKTMQYILSPEVPAIHSIPKRKVSLRWVSTSAAAILLLIAGYLVYQHNSNKITLQTVATALGESKTLTLTDGSVVHLNGGSSIQFPEKFSQQQRTLTLAGEAFFEVSPDNTRPFVVRTGELATTVLGTSFNITTRNKEAGITVAVKTGKVLVAASNKEANQTKAALLPGMQATYNAQQQKLVVSPVHAANVGSWQNNVLVFDNISLEEICLALERKYGVQFVASSPALYNCRFSTRFDGLTLQASIDKLSILGSLSFTRQHNMILIKGKPCTP